MWIITILGALKGLIKPAKWALEQVAIWASNRAELQMATQDAKIAEITARQELAVTKLKSDLEWDLTWAGQAPGTWKDEFVLLLFSVPIIMFLPAFLPGAVGEFWLGHYMRLIADFQRYSPNIIVWYLGGWSVMVAAIYGNKAAIGVMMGDTVQKIAEAFKPLPDDVPDAAVKAAEAAVKERLEKVKAKRAKEAGR